MKKVIIFSVMALTLFVIACTAESKKTAPKAEPAVAPAAAVAAGDGGTNEHPMEMGKMECIACHSDPDMVSNTDVVKEYNLSMHNFAGVACGNCHGDEADFRSKPPRASCEPCHSDQVANVNSTLPCQSCHIVHTYNVHMPRMK